MAAFVFSGVMRPPDFREGIPVRMQKPAICNIAAPYFNPFVKLKVVVG